MSIRDNVRNWLADHLAAIVIVLLALWAPPIIFTVLVDLKLVEGAGSGYPALRDPGLVLSVLQIALMTAAALMLILRRASAWPLLAGALAVWFAHAAWVIQGRLRLLGLHDLRSKETLITVTALAIASVVILEVRDRVTRSGGSIERTTDQQPAGLRRGTT